ncbi:MAG: L-arabinose isomerase family protein [Planctomycetota bacterium]
MAKLQPILAKKGEATINASRLAEIISSCGQLEPTIVVQSPEHWQRVVTGLGDDVDAILPISIPAYPTEVWNSHPQVLIERGLPLIFWSLMKYDEPDFWRWSARDFLRALGVEVHIAVNTKHGRWLLKSLALKRFVLEAKMVVFGEQNFPWNATAGGFLIKESLGTDIIVRSITDIRKRYVNFSNEQVENVWEERKNRYIVKSVKVDQLQEAIRVYLSIKSILEEEKAAAFGVNCFGDLVIKGGRDVPCLAQALLREDGYITSCDADYIAMMSMMLITHFLDKPCMMSNMYPVQYVGALNDHFGTPLSPDVKKYPKDMWKNLARLAHCGFVGIVPVEMTPNKKATLCDWAGTYEIKRDGRGCGIDSDLKRGEPITVVELCFDGKTLLIAEAKVCETTRHLNLPHCESSALLKFRDLEGFVNNISREHTAIAYGKHTEELKVMADILKLNCKIF